MGTKRGAKRAAEPVRLDPDKIVTAALNVADRRGVAGITMRAVGEELGADPTAVYRHFANKDALVSAMADRLFGEITEADLPRAWRHRLSVILTRGRDRYRAHPTVVEALSRHAEESPGLVVVNELMIGCLQEAGLDDSQVGLFHQALASYVLGTGLLEAAWTLPGVSREASRRWYAALDPDENPNCVAVAPKLFPPPDDVFDLAIEIFLDAIETAGKRRRASTTKTASTNSTTSTRSTTKRNPR